MVIEMMEEGQSYRLKLKGQTEIYLTGKVIEKTENSIKFLTIRNEEYLLRDDELAWAKRNEGEY
jgi:hypothetical protein